jgi:hypothetical protein
MPTRKPLLRAVTVASAALALLSGCVSSTTTGEANSWAFYYESLDSALASTHAIVLGTVVEATPVSDDNGIQYVTATVETGTVLAGDIGLGTIPVQQYGAEAQDPGIPHLEVGSTYLLFLESFNFESYQPCGPATGMYSVAAWGAWKQQDDGTLVWLTNSPNDLPIGAYPTVLDGSDVSALPERWASAREGATHAELCS